jgi:cytochrome c556
VAAGGAPLTLRLLEEDTTRWPFDEGEMKRRRRCNGSLVQRVAQELDAAAPAR